MSTNIEKSDSKLGGFSATFLDKGLTPKYRSKSLSSDKLNSKGSYVDRAAILEDVESHHISDKHETPGCLVAGMDRTQPTLNG